MGKPKNDVGEPKSDTHKELISHAGREASSFRDPSGFVFTKNGVLLRQVNEAYQEYFSLLRSSGLYEELVEQELLIPHEEVSLDEAFSLAAIAVIKPEPISFISYPYEWTFSQLQDAALLTLDIQSRAMRRGLSLKDASAFNVQFKDGKPIFIDTLSFQKFESTSPWVAYRQFCQHFFAPLALASLVDIRLMQLFRVYLDGIPLDLTDRLLPRTALLRAGLLTHIHLHAQAQSGASKRPAKSVGKMSELRHLALIDNLIGSVKSLHWSPAGTTWGDYYEHTNYSSEATQEKRRIVAELVDRIPAGSKLAWDFGANSGEISQIIAEKGIETIAWDFDPAAVEKGYRHFRDTKATRILPLILDLTNPSANLGWANGERDSLNARGPADIVMALALIHHLAIANNLPLTLIAKFFADCGSYLIVEFVDKPDSQVQRMLASRDDIFEQYHPVGFESAFALFFDTVVKTAIKETHRTIYLMRKRE